MAALGSMVNGQLTNNLVRQLAAIGIPAPYRSEVVTAVATGNVSGPATAASKNPAVASIVHRVIEAATARSPTGWICPRWLRPPSCCSVLASPL
jgi:hypothetical protein